MTFRAINGRQIEVLDEPDFFVGSSLYNSLDPCFEQKPVRILLAKRNNILFADNSGNIYIQRSLEKKTKSFLTTKREDTHRVPSILGKRKIEDAFGLGMHDKERYGQEVQPDFFKNNIGHCVYQNPIHSLSKNISPTQEAEIIDWCYKYLASKKA